jgi:hypothetical protein
VIVCLSEEFDAAGLGKGVKGAEDLRAVLLELFEQCAGYAVCDPEPASEFSYQIENQPVGGKVALVCNLAADRGVLVVVEIMAALVKDGIVPQPKRLMYLEVKNY